MKNEEMDIRLCPNYQSILLHKKNKKNKIGLKKVIDLDKVKLYLHLGIKSTVYGCKVKKKK